MSGNVFDLPGYLYGKGGKPSHGSSGPQMMINCPWCGRFGGFYVSLEEHSGDDGAKTYPAGSSICFKCGQKSRQFVFLYAELEGLTYTQARADLAQQRAGNMGRVIPPPVHRPAPLPPVEATTGAIHPEGFIPCWNESTRMFRMPTYLKQRGVARETARAYGLGWCEAGQYDGRMVYPIVCPSGTSFQTRSMDPDCAQRYRFLSGPGAGRLLFGWPQAVDSEVLVINEGPHDAMSVYQARPLMPTIGSVALLGKRLRMEQILMIRRHKAKRIILMLDGDALDDALAQHQQLGSRVAVAGLLDPTRSADSKDQLDAGDCSQMPERIVDAISRSLPPDVVRLARIQEKVSHASARYAEKM